jgi:ribulose kinase
MRTLIGAAVVAGVLAFAGPAAINSAAAAAPQMKAETAGSSDATDVSARRHYRHYQRYGYNQLYDRYRPYPSYYARPHYYRPYPYYAPAPFVFGFGFGPFWWD